MTEHIDDEEEVKPPPSRLKRHMPLMLGMMAALAMAGGGMPGTGFGLGFGGGRSKAKVETKKRNQERNRAAQKAAKKKGKRK
jgi:hypothetical protein